MKGELAFLANSKNSSAGFSSRPTLLNGSIIGAVPLATFSALPQPKKRGRRGEVSGMLWVICFLERVWTPGHPARGEARTARAFGYVRTAQSGHGPMMPCSQKMPEKRDGERDLPDIWFAILRLISSAVRVNRFDPRHLAEVLSRSC
jgi:hypothetical protein